MSFFEWTLDMEIDGGVIDNDHRQLIALINQLHEHTVEGRGREVVGQVLEQLLIYTKEHFAREEALMAMVGYPSSTEHHQQHERLFEQMRELGRLHETGSLAVSSLLSLACRDWLSLHIRRSDRAFGKHLRSLPGRLSAPP